MARSLYSFTQTRNYRLLRAPQWWKEDGVKYGKVIYYPRTKDHVDPPVTPSKVLMVRRVKPYRGNPWWDKVILDKLNLHESMGDIALVANTPENCKKLWQIKHVIKVTPINLPKNLPDEDAPTETWLHENGDLLVAPKADPKREKVTEEFMNNPKRLDRETMSKELRMRWLNPWTFP